jgi:hypothetical protein
MPVKTFTLDEANAYVPQLEDLLSEMLDLRDQLSAQSHVLESAMRHAPLNGGSKAASEYLLLLQRFNAAYKMLREIGCELKDLDTGLVDFPSYRDGRLIYLCWKRGEPRIEYWHDVESGFAGRQRL